MIALSGIRLILTDLWPKFDWCSSESSKVKHNTVVCTMLVWINWVWCWTCISLSLCRVGIVPCHYWLVLFCWLELMYARSESRYVCINNIRLLEQELHFMEPATLIQHHQHNNTMTYLLHTMHKQCKQKGWFSKMWWTNHHNKSFVLEYPNLMWRIIRLHIDVGM